MKATIEVKKEVEIKTLLVNAGVRYWEDSVINGKEDDENGSLVPCRDGDYWCPEIEVDTGKILNWPAGTTASIHYKVCDDGTYRMKDADGNIVSEIDGYVPSCLSPKEDGFGDYIIMDIDANGMIDEWKFTHDHVDYLLPDHE